MKLNLLFLTVFSFSVLSFANNGCVDPISETEQSTIVAAVNAETTHKISVLRTLTISKCITGDQMLELLGLVSSTEDKLTAFDILSGKLIDVDFNAEYKRVKSTFLN